MPRSARAPGIFISYRRDDSAGFAGRLYDRLSARFGAEHVFMDIDTISPGHEFAADIERALSECDACIVLIGRQWESITLPDGRRRLEDPTDFVRLEVAAAIRRGITVFPVLVEGAKPPAAASLPEDIRDVSGRQAIELSNERWNYDVGRLILALEQLGGAGERPPPPKVTAERSWRRPAMIAGGVAILLVLIGLVAWFAGRGGAPPPEGGFAACPAPVPSLPSSAPVEGFAAARTFAVSLTPVCQTGTPGSNNTVWTGTQSGVVEPTWGPETWTFSPTASGSIVWKFPERHATATFSPYEGSYEATSTVKSNACSDNTKDKVHATRTLYVSASDVDARAFVGWLVIGWTTCEGRFETQARVTGAQIDT
jgi:TIR domain